MKKFEFDVRKKVSVFIKDARNIHGYRYSYDKVVYTGNKNKVIITCPKHGDFGQVPNSHLDGHGCQKCGGVGRRTTKQFIEDCIRVHGSKYDYKQVIYKNCRSKVSIICLEHGAFLQNANSHLLGFGCPKCGAIRRANLNRNTNEDFIRRAKLIHGDRYDYSNVLYINSETKVAVKCRKHGVFYPLPGNHLGGMNCLRCAESKGEKLIADYLTRINILFERERRFKSCRKCKPLPFDFALPALGILIEYQGAQHFTPWRCWGGKRKLKEVQVRDAIKHRWARRNGWRLIRISYRIKNIEAYLDKRLSAKQSRTPSGRT